MNLDLQLKESLRYFLLPISFEMEDKCIAELKEIFSKSTLDSFSYSAFLRNKYNDWRFNQNGHVDPKFEFIVKEMLKVANPQNGVLFSDKYFEIHKALQVNPFITFELSTITLSHLRLIFILAKNERMSAAKISNVLKSVDSRLSDLSWKEVQIILRKLKILPGVEKLAAEELYLIDEELEVEYFADADIIDSAYMVGEVAKNLRFQFDAEKLLTRLVLPRNLHIPYLQILQYQCLISGFYDHILSVPYEFSPRGITANWIFSKWDKLVSTSNPFLNNAKGVDVLDENWARSRKTNEFESAAVLIDLLKGLDGMGFSASQELSSSIRQWLIRFIRINSIEIVPIKMDLTFKEMHKILNTVCSKPTETYGILEQRLVDFVARLKHIDPVWRPRGLKDSVNTNNLSKKKLGDCDFQNSVAKQIIAYEAHGGKLSRVYYEGHLKTFLRSFKIRIEELENIAEIKEWTVKIAFIAYDFEQELEEDFFIDGFKVQIEFIKFNDFLDSINLKSKNVNEIFKDLFVDVLNSRRTPKIARDRIHSLL
tara:strand:+ start:5424 stop:7040 length:1617 start_codon:yes stop_codon:yes gene_type:complete